MTRAKNLSEIEKLIARRVDFSLYGDKVIGKTINNCYVVLSYGYYPIYVFSFSQLRWFENRNGYSVSTKRHMRHCSIYDAELKTTQELEEMYK